MVTRFGRTDAAEEAEGVMISQDRVRVGKTEL